MLSPFTHACAVKTHAGDGAEEENSPGTQIKKDVSQESFTRDPNSAVIGYLGPAVNTKSPISEKILLYVVLFLDCFVSSLKFSSTKQYFGWFDVYVDYTKQL